MRTKLKEAMKTAMLNKEADKVSTIRMTLAKLKDQDIAARSKGNHDGITDSEICSMMQSMIKQRRESMTLYEKGNRKDLVDKEQAEIIIIEAFLPTQMNEAAIEEALDKIIADKGAKEMKDMGGVMGALKEAYAGQMDFGMASSLCRKKLAS